MTRNTAIPPVSTEDFQRPNALERALGRAFNWIIGLGGGFAHNHVLEVRGRKTGKVYRTPVNLMQFEDKCYLVAPRGRTAWVQNADAAGEVTLQRGASRRRFALRALPLPERPRVLQEYLRRYAPSVRGYFTVAPDAPVAEFAAVAARHPAYEIIALD